MSRRLASISRDYRVCAVLTGLLAFLVYLRTLAPTVMWYDMGELTTTSYVLGIAHNTGYPLYILLGKLFTFLPVGDVAYRVNLMSAVFAALTVSTVFLIVHELTKSRFAALVGALVLAFSSTFWANANWAESYSMNAFSTALITLLLLRWRESGKPWQLYLAFLVFGLSLGNHRLILLLAPGILAFVWSGRQALDRRRLISCGLVFLLGLSVYLYLPIRAAQHPALSWAQPANFHTYLKMFLTGDSSGQFWNFAFLGRLNILALFPLNEFSVFGLALAAMGLVYAWRRRRVLAVYGLLLCVLVGFVALTYSIHNVYNYLIPAYLVLAIWAGCGAAALLSFGLQLADVRRLRWAQSGQYFFSPLAAAVLLLLPVWLAARNLPRVDRSDDYSAHDFALTTLARVQPHSTIITDSWTASPLWYAQLVEGYRHDVLVSPLFSVPGEDINGFIEEQLRQGRPVYVAEGLRGDVSAIGSGYHVQPVLLDGIETMVTNVLPKPEYKDDLVPKGSLYRVLANEPSFTVDSVPGGARTLVNFGGGLDLVGFQTDTLVAQRGDVVRLDYYWRLSEKTGSDLQARLFFTDAGGLVATHRGFPLWWQGWELGAGVRPTSEWEPGRIVKEEYYLLVPRDVAPGTYNLNLRVRDASSALSLESIDGSGDGQTIGSLVVR
ncbi:MAG: DUF2723 domain-containing protein [Dehalococcoidia bacterium]|jgi:hypothetical protein